MKKLTIVMLAAAFAFTPMIQTDAQAATARPKAAKVQRLKKANQRLHNRVKRLRHKLQAQRQHGHKAG